jgi:hypothetical protein
MSQLRRRVVHLVLWTTSVVSQIINAIDFEEIKARAMEMILRNEARGAQLTGIVDHQQAEDGEVDGRECLIHG